MAITSVSRVRLHTIVVFLRSCLSLLGGVNFTVSRVIIFYIFFFRTVYVCPPRRSITLNSIFLLYKESLPVFLWHHSFHNTEISCLLFNKTFLGCFMFPFCLLTKNSVILFEKFPLWLSSSRLFKNLHLGFWPSVIKFIIFYLPSGVDPVVRGIISEYEFFFIFQRDPLHAFIKNRWFLHNHNLFGC